MEGILSYLVENYGGAGVLIIAITLMAYFIIRELRKANTGLIEKQQEMNERFASSFSSAMTTLSEKLTEDLREQNKTLMKLFVEQQNGNERTHQKNLLTRRNVTSEINNIINQLRIEIESDRVTILEFHNSFANQTGFPFLKFTVTYEKISKGSKTVSQNYQSMQFSAISDIVEKVTNSPEHMCVLKDLNEIENMCPMILNDSKIPRGYIFKGIFDSTNNMLIGLMGILFKNKIPEIYDKTPIIATARTIGELLTLTKYTDE